MTCHSHSHARSDDPGDVIATLVYQLGFHPSESLIVVARDSNSQNNLMGIRTDLPTTTNHRPAIQALLTPLLNATSIEVTVLVVAGLDNGRLPARALVEECRAVFAAAGVPIRHAFWSAATTPGARWRSYDDAAHCGTVPDLATSALAAYSVLAGQVMHSSREDLAATLAPDPDDVLVRRAAVLESLDTARLLDRNDPYQRFMEVGEAVRTACDGRLPTSDEAAMRLVLALRDHAVRDACLSYADGELHDGAEQLWRYLVRVTPGADRAEPAVLLAVTAYVNSDGVGAGIALEMAGAADPKHRLAELIGEMLTCGTSPDRFRLALGGAVSAAVDHVMTFRP